MSEIWMDVDTAVIVPMNVMPLIQVADFKTIEQAFVYNMAGIAVQWNFVTTAGVMTTVAITPTTAGVYDISEPLANVGMYGIEIPASGGASANNDTEGFGWITGRSTAVLPFRGPVIGFRAAGINNVLVDTAYSATRGLAGTALPDAAAEAAGGLYTRGTGAGQLAQDANGNVRVNVDTIKTNPVANGGTVTFPTNATLASTTNITAGTVAVATSVTNGVTLANGAHGGAAATLTLSGAAGLVATKIDAPINGAIAGNITGNLSGSVGSVTGAVGSVTGGATSAELAKVPKSDSTVTWNATALASINAEVDTALNTAIPGSPTANSVNERVATMDGLLLGTIQAGTHVAQSGDSFARLGAPAAASIAADLLAIDNFVDDLEGRLTATRAGYLDQLEHIHDDTNSTYNIVNSGTSGNAAINTKIDTIAGYLDTEVAAILADTNELQTDWANGGRLDLILDAASAPSAAAVADAVWDEALSGHATGGSAGAALSGASAPSAASVADAVWDEALSGHSGAGTAGLALATASSGGVDPSVLADAIWDEALSGHSTAGTSGKKLTDLANADLSGVATSTNLATVDTVVDGLATELAKVPKSDGSTTFNATCSSDIKSSLATQAELNKVPKSDGSVTFNATALASINTQADLAISDAALATATNLATVDTVVDAIKAKTDNLPANPSSLDAAGVRTAVGLASANLDTQISGLPTDADVNAACDTAISDAALATAANLAVVDGNVDTILAAVDTEIAALISELAKVPKSDSNVSWNATALNAIANNLLDLSNAIETGLTLRQAHRLEVAAAAGKISGAATTEVVVRNAIADTKPRITATVDADGNRSAITADLT
jgi:hypothetical protein